MTSSPSLTDWLTSISAVLTAGTALLALGYAHVQLRSSHQQARVQHLLTFCHSYVNDPMTTIRSISAAKYLTGESDSSEMGELANFFEQIGLLVDRGYLDKNDAWEMFGYAAIPVFETCSTWIEDLRLKDVNAFTHFKNLYLGFVETERKNGGHEFHLDHSAIVKYWDSEREVKPGAPLPGPRLAGESAASASA
jgi:hypothetical protein